MDRKQALDTLENGWGIYSPEHGEGICQALDVPFHRAALVRRWHSDPPGTLKGLTMRPEHEGAEGVRVLQLGQYIAEKLGEAG